MTVTLRHKLLFKIFIFLISDSYYIKQKCFIILIPIGLCLPFTLISLLCFLFFAI